MHAVAVKTRKGLVTIRPLSNGDTETVERVFDALGDESRRLRFGTSKETLSASELARLARVDGDHHVLVASIVGTPVGIAHLVRDDDRRFGEVAWAIADVWQGGGIGTALARLLVADAAAAGITHVRGAMRLENRASLSLMRKVTTVVSRHVAGGEIDMVGLTA